MHESDPWWPWTQLYRHLKALGKWDDALAEMNAFLAYAEERDRMPDRHSMYYTCLYDLGDTYAALGDYDTALEYHKQSLAVAGDYQEWLNRTGRNTDPGPHALVRSLGVTLAPRLRALSTLSAAKGDMMDAWEYHNQATDLLTDFFRRECDFRGLDVGVDEECRSGGLNVQVGGTSSAPPQPPLDKRGQRGGLMRDESLRLSSTRTLYELCLAVIDDGDKGTESMVVKVREHLRQEAMLFRLERDLGAAEQALDLGATLPAYPFHNESRLDFNEPMERLRIAIARGGWIAALAAADEAERHTGPRHFEGHPTHPPIGVIARAELTFLRGVALAGIDPQDTEAKLFIGAGIDLVNQSGVSLPATERDQFLLRFASWKAVAEEVTESLREGN